MMWNIYICVSESHFSFRWKRGRGHADKKQGIDTIACITARKVRATIRRRLAALSFGTATKRANNTGFKNRLHPCKTVSDYAPVLRPPLPPPLSLSLSPRFSPRSNSPLLLVLLFASARCAASMLAKRREPGWTAY